MKRLSTLVFVVLLLGGSVGAWWRSGLDGPSPRDKTQKIFIIPRGRPIRDIGASLKKESLIRDPVVFFLYLKTYGRDKSIQAGDYRLSPSMDLKTLVDTLQHGTLDVWVTVPEGQQAQEIADTLAREKFKNYSEEWRSILRLDEGYLFPDTYLIPRDASVEQIAHIMKNNFFGKVATLDLSKNSPELRETVILASLVEREAKGESEKPIIAGILKNRLDTGMALQVDATIQYAKGYDAAHKTWWGIVTPDDYRAVRSPYNTYLVAGLPPSPISNPGLSALRAVSRPASTPYFYYLHDKTGKIHYARTVQEHTANIEKYLQ